MKITKLILKGVQQFQDLELDFTHPETGQPLERVCFIGANGTGKSTLLRVLKGTLRDAFTWPFPRSVDFDSTPPAWIAGEFSLPSQRRFVRFATNRAGHAELWSSDVLTWLTDWLGEPHIHNPGSNYLLSKEEQDQILTNGGISDLVIHVIPDASSLLNTDPPKTNVDKALEYSSSNKNYWRFSEVDTAHAENFWNLLIYHIKKRDSNWQEFQRAPENRNKTIAQAEAEFSEKQPEILPQLAELWDKILAKAHLQFDLANARIPIQLSDNLEAFIKLKGSGEALKYNALSTGIRNFIFRLGHIFALYFGRQIKRGFLFLDEPENSLYPDFLYDLMDVYWDIIKDQNTQFFVATHHPIIAAQFEPYERFHLAFNEDGSVSATRGVSPIGDDPNDLLEKDFRVRSVYPRQGEEKWERYLKLRRLIKETQDPEKRAQLMDEYMTIGNAYNFLPHALS